MWLLLKIRKERLYRMCIFEYPQFNYFRSTPKKNTVGFIALALAYDGGVCIALTGMNLSICATLALKHTANTSISSKNLVKRTLWRLIFYRKPPVDIQIQFLLIVFYQFPPLFHFASSDADRTFHTIDICIHAISKLYFSFWMEY